MAKTKLTEKEQSLIANYISAIQKAKEVYAFNESALNNLLVVIMEERGLTQGEYTIKDNGSGRWEFIKNAKQDRPTQEGNEESRGSPS